MSEPETMTAEVERLQGVIHELNDLANHGFGAVASIARLAQRGLADSLSSPLGHGDLQTALLTLASLADDYANTIDVTAEAGTRQDSAT